MDLISIIPPSPNSETPVTIAALWTGCIIDSGIQRTGNTFQIHFNYQNICFSAAPGGTMNFDVGLLRPGSYNVIEEVLFEGESAGNLSISFRVSAAPGTVFPVPTLDIGAMGILSVALVLASVLFYRLTIRSTRP